jgi:predicted PurR-regulated permease PerM
MSMSLSTAPRIAAPRERLTSGQITLIAGLILAAVAAAWALGHVLMLIFFAILLGAALRGATDWVTARTRLPDTVALAAVIVAFAAALAAMAFWVGPNLFGQLNDLVARLQAEAQSLRKHLQDAGVIQGGAQLQGLAERAVSPAAQIFTLSLATLTELFVAVITAIYFAASPSIYVGGVVRLVPMQHRARLRQVFRAVAHALRMWVLGQLISMIAVGVLASAGLWLVGVPAPFAIGLISGLLTFVPYVGTILSGAIAVLIALSAGLATAAWALGVYIVCHLFEGYVIAPVVQRRILELPPALSVLSMTVLGTLFSLPGVILGTPAAAAVLVLVQSLYVGDVLGDHEGDPTLD